MLELIGKKIGMTHIFKENGSMVPLTMVKLYDNCVIEVNENQDKDFDNVVLGFEKTDNVKKLTKPVAGIFNKKSLPMFKKLHGSKIKKNADLKVSNSISVDEVLSVGDKVSISGITAGKGFAGVMKRWNFRGLEASHGVSVSHRSHGSTGQRQDPGKTFKGKKMAGHMGVDKITTKNLEVVIIDKEQSIFAVKGAVPGLAGSDVILKIAKKF